MPPAYGFIQTQARRGIGARDDDEIRITPCGHRSFNLARMFRHRNHRPRAGHVAATLGHHLIFDVNARHTRRLKLTHGVRDVDGIAVAGVGITQQRNVYARRRAMRMRRKQREIDQAHVRAPQQ